MRTAEKKKIVFPSGSVFILFILGFLDLIYPFMKRIRLIHKIRIFFSNKTTVSIYIRRECQIKKYLMNFHLGYVFSLFFHSFCVFLIKNLFIDYYNFIHSKLFRFYSYDTKVK